MFLYNFNYMLYFWNQLSLNPIKKNSGTISNTCTSHTTFWCQNCITWPRFQYISIFVPSPRMVRKKWSVRDRDIILPSKLNSSWVLYGSNVMLCYVKSISLLTWQRGVNVLELFYLLFCADVIDCLLHRDPPIFDSST